MLEKPVLYFVGSEVNENKSFSAEQNSIVGGVTELEVFFHPRSDTDSRN